MNIYFDISKLSRIINTHGQDFVFSQHTKNSYGEPTQESTQITIRGLFHQTRGYVTKDTSEGTISRSKPQPQILTLLDDFSTALRCGDRLEYKSKKYSVIAVDDVNNLGIALEISLELIDNGT